MDDDLQPEVGDTVVFNEHEYFNAEAGRYKPSSDRGEIVRVFKNGSIKVLPENSDTSVKLLPAKYTIIAKAG